MLKDLIIFAVFLVLFEIAVIWALAKLLVHRTKNAIKRRASFSVAKWHLRQYNRLKKK